MGTASQVKSMLSKRYSRMSHTVSIYTDKSINLLGKVFSVLGGLVLFHSQFTSDPSWRAELLFFFVVSESSIDKH